MIGVSGHPKQLADPPESLRIGALLTRLAATFPRTNSEGRNWNMRGLPVPADLEELLAGLEDRLDALEAAAQRNHERLRRNHAALVELMERLGLDVEQEKAAIAADKLPGGLH